MKNHFSAGYGDAQRRFREGVARKGGRLDSLELTVKGPANEALTIDIGWFGDVHAERVLVHSSGIHGVEAFAGSAIQLQFLAGEIPALQTGEAIVLVHVANPYGMAWLRRFNENNVDLNRNFLAPGEGFSGAPEGYRKLDGFLNPRTPPGGDYFYFRAAALVARYGLAALRQAVAEGQYDYPKGLFFGGHRREEGPEKLRYYLAERLHDVRRIAAIDIHTGLGDFGEDHLLVDADGSAEANQSMLEVYGKRVQGLDMSGVAYKVRGDQGGVYRQLFPEAKVHFATQEFGTYNAVRAVAALRAENRWHLYGGGAMNHAAKRELAEFFNPSNDRWRQTVLRRGREVIQQGLTLSLGRGQS